MTANDLEQRKKLYHKEGQKRGLPISIYSSGITSLTGKPGFYTPPPSSNEEASTKARKDKNKSRFLLCIETGKIYFTIKHAMADTGDSQATIVGHTKDGSTIANKRWRFVTESEVADVGLTEQQRLEKVYSEVQTIRRKSTQEIFFSVAEASKRCGLSCYAIKNALRDENSDFSRCTY